MVARSLEHITHQILTYTELYSWANIGNGFQEFVGFSQDELRRHREQDRKKALGGWLEGGKGSSDGGGGGSGLSA